MRILPLFTVAALACTATIALADGTTRIAVVDSARLYDTGGIKRWLTARAKLDADRAKFVIVESPEGKPLADGRISMCQEPSNDEAMKKLCKDMAEAKRKQQEDEVWSEHEWEVLEPIQADVARALERYARARGIDLVLDRHELGEMLIVVAASADITTAFIKDYNKDYNATTRPRSGAR